MLLANKPVPQVSLVPYSCSESDDSSYEDENCVGKRGYKKKSTVTPKKTPEKKVLPNPCTKHSCPHQCWRLCQTSREHLNEHFWGLSAPRRKSWLISCVRSNPIKRRRGVLKESRRNISYKYSISYEDTVYIVCQKFILATLNISQMMLRYALLQRNIRQIKAKAVPHNKTDERSLNLLREYFEKLPAVPSHYCRAKSGKVYLPQEFRNIKTLYKCYIDYMNNKNLDDCIVSNFVFRNIFKNEFKIGFHLPKKDKCTKCENIKNMCEEERNTFINSNEYKTHIRDKDEVKTIFLTDQNRSKSDSSFLCASFDLQKVLNTPFGKNITLFYARKYAYYNFSVYENGTRNGYCFLWGERDGKRGCIEICTALYKYLQIVDQRQTAKKLSLYCDSCAGQNRNKAMLAMIAYFLNSSHFIEEIQITYLLPGHTMMPVDSVHSTIESFVRNRTIWAPSEWPTIIRNSRTNPSVYDCIELSHAEFKDWKSLANFLFPNKIKLNLSNLRMALFQKNFISVELHYGYFENCNKKTMNNFDFRFNLETLYHKPLHISSKKFNDLQNLCLKNSIPSKYHEEYLNLKHSASVKDRLNESDNED